MKALTAPLEQYGQYRESLHDLFREHGYVLYDRCAEPSKQQLIYTLSREESSDADRVLIVTYSDLKARRIRDEYAFYDRNTVLFPAKDLIFYQADLRGRQIVTERMRALRRILEGRKVTVVTTFAALMTPAIPLDVFRSHILELSLHQNADPQELARKLAAMGYERCGRVDEPGQFSVRGDILDIFDLTDDNPVRLEFWGDEIESVRSFDAQSQRSIADLSQVRIFPGTELMLSRSRLNDGLDRMEAEKERVAAKLFEEGKSEAAHRLRSDIGAIREEALEWGDYSRLESYIHYFYPHTENFLDLFDPEKTLLVLDEPAKLESHARAVEAEFHESMTGRMENGYILPGLTAFLATAEEVAEETGAFRRAALCELAAAFSMFPAGPLYEMKSRPVQSYNRSFETLCQDLSRYRKEGYRILLISPSRTRARRLALDLTDNGLTAFYSEDPDRILEKGEIMTYYGQLGRGFEYPELKFALIAESDIFGQAAQKKKHSARKDGERLRNWSELKAGDYVVHENYGIGIYRGVEKIEVDRISQDYIKIEYSGGGTLYVLPTEMDVLQKYAAAGSARPKVSRLGSSEWRTTRAKVKSAVEEVADDLVKLYAARQSRKGHVFTKDTVWQKEFEELFTFEETDDQLEAIEETKRDMESDRIMDRLICGDVGFGKTEVALRAAFKAVQDSMQVAVLVPTTILAQQHFNTFTERMKNFPVRVEMLSRFKTAAEQKKTVEGLKNGMVDIVIGTHRLLSKDVEFRSLGLLVIDEEQRFGVSHKEKIKKIKEDVDVLTLTATPIPRTLHMSLTGIRDMSLLEQAPSDRVPIQTYVMEYNEELVREAVLRELSRNGQIYYVYNRTEDIAEVTGKLQVLIPEARIGFAHGQMKEEELEKIMFDFIRGELDMLVSTTIIETGLDIPNVNTIVVHDSDQMGLSQLYQLRGRVGRSDRTAYAFLMYKRNRMLREVAEKRLAAIREYTDLGSGFRIAMRDLEIRGAGNILGRSQHGHMQAVGYDMYCKLLETAVRERKGEEVSHKEETTVRLSVDAYIPSDYIMNEQGKIEIYRRIAAIGSTSDLKDLEDELRDRYGDILPPVRNLLRIALIRSVAANLDISSITGSAGSVTIVPMEKADLNVANIPLLLQKVRKGTDILPKGAVFRFTAKDTPGFYYEYKTSGSALKDEEDLLSVAEELLLLIADTLK